MMLNTWIDDNVPDFIDHVRRITEDSVIVRRGELSKPAAKKTIGENTSAAEKTCFTCKKPGHLSKDCRIAKATCFKCGQTGHLSPMCPKKETSRVSTLNHVEQQEENSSSVGLTTPEEDTLQIGQIRSDNGAKSCINIFRLSNNNIKICALMDTGSPVNLIKKSVYEKFFNSRELFKVKKEVSYKGINESPVLIYGKIYDQIILESMRDSWFDIVFLVVDDKTMRYDVIMSRKFLNNSNLKLIYYNNRFVFEPVTFHDKLSQDIFTINVIEPKGKYDIVFDNIDNELSIQDQHDLLNTFKETDEMPVEKVNDNYYVSVYIKDHSLFRYAPRRMSIAEKNELQEIIDDLLKRSIVKPSISPYCSRVILVSKRNGKKRMCIDLRPLNQRIYPQKYPFPIIEDHLDKLYGKKIFTKLDLKDGFHQIDIHPEHTKYFSFATPTGQYEFVKMPSGYCEAPAEFQKRVIQIFDSLIRSGKILIYIDDILIPTVTVKENLEILKE
ncbi:retroelement polyprotein, partial [Lasius niger]